MRGDVYELRDPSGDITHWFEVTNDDRCLMGNCYYENGDFVADIYCKWDACTHWRFYGEDYYEGISDIDPYYHLCGGYSFMNYITAMCFVWKLSELIIASNFTDSNKVHESYNDHERITKLVDSVLEGHEIVKR